ncbi:carboxymuconolactone decarboxylase family protein [Rodentibacter pneumotropicus]|uniref:Carboxymuconolactone decarboxylase family protein n=1 Tax=Rodentibacter pneumotropicus TaxID=758 RepID=A0A448MSZ7_9PAST|nr:carboxymuconolactone decarboxylase family protein [Rodentibacter pneumotropicus]
MLQAYQALGAAAAEGNILDAKTRELIALAVAVTTRCESCISVHAEEAVKAGATEEEVSAALAMSIALNAGAAYTYSLRALEAFNVQKGNNLSKTIYIGVQMSAFFITKNSIFPSVQSHLSLEFPPLNFSLSI